jgi:hypothetical protein
MLAPIIVTLLNAIRVALVALIEFLITMILGALFAILVALPWVLRAASVLVWLSAAYLGLTSIQTIYAPNSPAIPVIALQFAVILVSVGWVLFVLSKNTRLVWGGMAAGGLVIGGASIASSWLLSHWRYADLFFRVLPPALFSVLLIYETIHLRSMRRNRNVKPETGVDEPKEIASDLLEINPAIVQ